MKTIATTTLILLIGLFGHAQEGFLNKGNDNNVSVHKPNRTLTKNKKEFKSNDDLLEVKKLNNIREVKEEVAIRFQEKWLKVTLLA